MLRHYDAREWFRSRFGVELYEVHDADLMRFVICKEAVEQLYPRK